MELPDGVHFLLLLCCCQLVQAANATAIDIQLAFFRCLSGWGVVRRDTAMWYPQMWVWPQVPLGGTSP